MSTIIQLPRNELPRQWYNLAADLSRPVPPPLGPDGNPVTPEQLAPVFPGNLIEQEMCTQRWVDIPAGVLELLSRWRPTPLHRAERLEQALGTPARIYFKNESVSPPGSHKPNTAVAQAWYNREAGIRRLTTETGAGQWGSALAYACSMLGMECRVYMVRISFDQKPMRKTMMQAWGAHCLASPSSETASGRRVLESDPDTPGSLGIAISEAVEAAVSDPTGRTKYSLGSVLNHVMLHQSVIGQEAQQQMKLAGEKKVDTVIGCVGGGSNFAGLAFPFVRDKIHGREIDIIPVEPTSCPTLTRAPYTYDHGDASRLTPLLAMHSLGHGFIPPPIHAGGLRYHGMAPMVSEAAMEGLLRPRAYPQLRCYEAAAMFARTEGMIVAPETSHAVAAAIDEAVRAREEGRQRVILFNLSGHGLMDLSGYARFFNGDLTDHALPENEMAASLRVLRDLPRPPIPA